MGGVRQWGKSRTEGGGQASEAVPAREDKNGVGEDDGDGEQQQQQHGQE